MQWDVPTQVHEFEHVAPEGGTETVSASSADLTFWAPGLLLSGEPLPQLPASTEIPPPKHTQTYTHTYSCLLHHSGLLSLEKE